MDMQSVTCNYCIVNVFHCFQCCNRVRGTALTVVCLEGLGLDHLTAVAAHHQVEVILRRTLAKYWHVCVEAREATTGQRATTSQCEATGNTSVLPKLTAAASSCVKDR